MEFPMKTFVSNITAPFRQVHEKPSSSPGRTRGKAAKIKITRTQFSPRIDSIVTQPPITLSWGRRVTLERVLDFVSDSGVKVRARVLVKPSATWEVRNTVVMLEILRAWPLRMRRWWTRSKRMRTRRRRRTRRTKRLHDFDTTPPDAGAASPQSKAKMTPPMTSDKTIERKNKKGIFSKLNKDTNNGEQEEGEGEDDFDDGDDEAQSWGAFEHIYRTCDGLEIGSMRLAGDPGWYVMKNVLDGANDELQAGFVVSSAEDKRTGEWECEIDVRVEEWPSREDY